VIKLYSSLATIAIPGSKETRDFSVLNGQNDVAFGPGFSYLEHVANLSQSIGNTTMCGRFATIGQCQGDKTHKIGKILVCGREWCPVCGQRKSDAHKRRYGRMMPKAQQMRSIGIFTLTWPVDERKTLRTKTELYSTRKKAVKVLKSFDYKRGISRWHWYGDAICHCGMKGKEWADKRERKAGIICPIHGKIEFTQLKNEYHPHLNIIVDAGKLSLEMLEKIKNKLRKATGAGVIHYGFASNPGKILHRIRYITRSTFRAAAWDTEMAKTLQGFRNLAYWGIHGEWDRQPVWSLADLPKEDKKELEGMVDIFAGRCPMCKEDIIWGNLIVDGLKIKNELIEPLDAGYFMIILPRV